MREAHEIKRRIAVRLPGTPPQPPKAAAPSQRRNAPGTSATPSTSAPNVSPPSANASNSPLPNPDAAFAQNLGAAPEARPCSDRFSRELPSSTIRAAIEIERKNPTGAVELLQAASTYELGGPPPTFSGTLYPVYVRGQAELLLHHGSEAAVEFQKFLDHPGIVLNYHTGALAHLGLSRAYVLQGDTANARAAYREFLTLWKDADPDIPVLIAAKAEYAKLK
jgi:hypothetical protein